MSNRTFMHGVKFVVEPTVSVYAVSGFTLDNAKYMFVERDRWLAEFIFNNFQREGLDALERLYHRLREVSVELK